MSARRGGARKGRANDPELRVDWQACKGRGLCHEVLPELISLDDWGYPVIDGSVPAALLAQAGRAVRSCPQLALRLETPAAGRRCTWRRVLG